MSTVTKGVRNLTPEQLGISEPGKSLDSPHKKKVSGFTPSVATDDPILQRVIELIDDGFAGVILEGSPGTGKSWYAKEIAYHLTSGNFNNVISIQFHPGYQYEEFIEGYVPDGNGGFKKQPMAFLNACTLAKDTDDSVVLIIDEFSRADTARVFGEALTYLEKTKRDQELTLASGSKISIPDNLVILATMNPWDRGVEELDLALERRFAKLKVNPDIDILKKFISNSEVSDSIGQKLIQFFHITSSNKNPLCRIGHAYFSRITTEESLRRVWENQLLFHFEKALRNDEEELNKIKSAWERIFTS
ncbi:TPA: AAA domain-containing protein [Vibrio vulnificus]|nr:AAA domain-containing protein [Vibrio vulnificus]HDY7588901.1 AAA family ATPase [Vibrio vulnificus]